MSEICNFWLRLPSFPTLGHCALARARAARALASTYRKPLRYAPCPNRSPVPRPRSRGLPRPLLLTYDPAPLALRRTCGRRRRSDAAPRTRPLGSLDDDGPRVAPPRRSHRTRPPRVARRQRGTRAGGAQPRAGRKRAARRDGRGGGGRVAGRRGGRRRRPTQIRPKTRFATGRRRDVRRARDSAAGRKRAAAAAAGRAAAKQDAARRDGEGGAEARRDAGKEASRDRISSGEEWRDRTRRDGTTDGEEKRDRSARGGHTCHRFNDILKATSSVILHCVLTKQCRNFSKVFKSF